MNRRSAALPFLLLALATEASAGVGQYLRDYQLGVEEDYDVAAASLHYDAPAQSPLPKGCVLDTKNPSVMHCAGTLVRPTDWATTVFLQQPFKQKGLFLIDADLAFSLVGVDASLQPPAAGDVPQPLTQARLHLYGLNTTGYVQVGLTPQSHVPDLLLSLGLGLEAEGGNVVIEGQRQNVEVIEPQLYVEGEIVWLRFGKKSPGAISTYMSVNAGGLNHSIDNHTINGMSHFVLVQSEVTLGLVKVVLPFP